MIDLPVGVVLLPLTASCGLEILSLLALRAFVGEVPLSSTVEARSPTSTVWSDIAVLHLLKAGASGRGACGAVG